MTKAFASFLAAAALLLSAAAVARADDKDKLQGDWIITAMTMNGMVATEAELKGGVMTFKGDKVSVKIGDNTPDEESFELGKAGEVATITVTDKDKKKYKGIYKFEDDGKTLTMCFSDGPELPTKFEAPKPPKEGVENILIVVKKKG